MVNAGYSPSELFLCGYSLHELTSSGCNVDMNTLKKESSNTIENFELPIKDLLEAGYSIEQLKQLNYPAKEFYQIKFPAIRLYESNYSLEELRIAGYDEEELNLILRKLNERIERNLQIIEEYDKKIKPLRNNQEEGEEEDSIFRRNCPGWASEETVNYLLNQQNQQNEWGIISSTNITSINPFDIFSDINCKCNIEEMFANSKSNSKSNSNSNSNSK